MKRVAVQRKRKIGNAPSLKNPVAKSAKKVPYSSVQPALANKSNDIDMFVYKLKPASEMKLSDEEFMYVTDMDDKYGVPLIPVTEEMIVGASKLKLEFERILKDMDVVMDNSIKLIQLGRKAKDLQTKYSDFFYKQKSAKYEKSKVCDARKKAKQAAMYWRAEDPMVYAEWLIFL